MWRRFNFTKRQWLTLCVIGIADFCNAICISLQAPFFPAEAEKKGSTATEYGLFFGIFEMIIFITSPVYGKYVNVIGPQALFNAGIFTTGAASICLGLIDKIQSHVWFISTAFVIRIIEAIGDAAFLTASFAITAREFPDNVCTIFALLESCVGLGLIVGPTVGGGLYSLGGYYLPFVALGCVLLLTGLFTVCFLPKYSSNGLEHGGSPSIWSVLRIPGVMIPFMTICATSASIGFLAATLEPHVREFNLSPVLLGVIFVVNGGIYAITAPLWGWIVDRFINPKLASFLGSLFIISAFLVVGPAPFIPVDTNLTYVLVAMVLHGIGIGAALVSTFSDALRVSIGNGLPDNTDTYGLISGLWNSAFSLGAFVGPSISGALYDWVGFRSASLFVVGTQSLVGIMLVIFMVTERRPNGREDEHSSKPLLANKHNGVDGSFKNGYGLMDDRILCGTSIQSQGKDQIKFDQNEPSSSVHSRISYGSLDCERAS